jgi:amino acid adenylation domain-containing protein
MRDQPVIQEAKIGLAGEVAERLIPGVDLPQFELMTDFSRHPQANSQLSVLSRPQPSNFAARIGALASQCGVTPSTAYLAILATLLMRYSGETSIVVGIGGREYAVNLDLSGDPSFCELLTRIASQGQVNDLCFTLAEITIAATPSDDGGQLSCQFASNLYRSETIERLLQHFESLATDIMARPHSRLSEFSFLSQAELTRLLHEWNKTSTEYPRDLSVHQLLEHSAKQFSKSCAVEFGDKTISFGELDVRSNRLSHYLAARGAGPGAIVGIMLDRSIEMVVALLAVLKTGSAYLPLDPSFPASRLEFMAADAGLAVLVTSGTLAVNIATSVPAVLMDREREAIHSMPEEALGRYVEGDAVAYVLFTSGSTGKPKGVQIQHRSVVNLLCGMQAHVQIQPQESLLAVTTLSFDIAGLELLLPLMTGSRIVLASSAQASDPIALRDLLHSTKPNLMQATPSTWRMLVDAGWTGSAGLKVLVGGEKVTRDIADALLERAAKVWNCYGPTETTIWSTICKLEQDGQPVTIGRPLANTSLYILDSHHHLVPQGCGGELYIGGDGVARGYLNRADLNEELFIANPFGAGRLYRTGDIVRYQPDGRLEILGRNDAQVKVRGFRIELGDVEEALAACPGVRAAAVVVGKDASGESVLAGYFETDHLSNTEASHVRGWLSTQIPDYMVPTFLVPMPALPLTLNGKIDRKALAIPEIQATPQPTPEVVTDRLEATLIGIWESVLGVRPVGRTHNFFDLGGHSVLAAKAFARMEKTLGTALPLATLFQAPTVEKLARVIRNSNWKPLWSSLVAIRPAGSTPPFFFVHPIGGNVLNFAGFCGHFGPDRPIYGLQARGLNGEEAPHTLVEEMAKDYIRGIRSVQPEGPYLIGGFSAGGVVAFEMAQQLSAAGQHVATLALLDTLILIPHVADGPLGARIGRWLRTAKMNFRYATRMRLPEFLSRKSTNFRMRRKLLTWQIREKLGLTVQPARLSAEEGFLLAIRRYIPRPYHGNATLFRAGDGSHYPESKLGWEGLIEGDLDVQQVSGDHDTILQEPHIGMLARLLEGCLEQAPLELPQKPGMAATSESTQRMGRLTPAIELAKL